MTVLIPAVIAFEPFFKYGGRYLFAWGGRGSAKSVSISQIILNRGREKKLRILCTREIQKSIKESVHTLLKDLILKYQFNDYEVQNNLILNRITGTEIIFVGLREHNITSIQSYANIDICWVEEAQAVTAKSLNILTPTIRKAGSQLIFTYNRYEELDPVHKLAKRELTENENKLCVDKKNKYNWVEYRGPDALGVFINYNGNPFFPKELEKEMEKDKEDEPDLYLHKWLGEPVSQDDYSLIARKLVMEATDRKVKDWNFICFGVDPARYGKDNSVIAIRRGFEILPLFVFRGIDNMRLVGEVLEKASKIYKDGYKKIIQINIDVGMGTGVIDRLIELEESESLKPDKEKTFNIEVNEIDFGGASTEPKYFNTAAEIWGNMRDALKTMRIPYDTDLISELTTRKYKLQSDSMIRLVSKEEMRSKGLPSPDRGDACALCLWKTQSLDFDKMEIERKKN